MILLPFSNDKVEPSAEVFGLEVSSRVWTRILLVLVLVEHSLEVKKIELLFLWSLLLLLVLLSSPSSL